MVHTTSASLPSSHISKRIPSGPQSLKEIKPSSENFRSSENATDSTNFDSGTVKRLPKNSPKGLWRPEIPLVKEENYPLLKNSVRLQNEDEVLTKPTRGTFPTPSLVPFDETTRNLPVFSNHPNSPNDASELTSDTTFLKPVMAPKIPVAPRDPVKPVKRPAFRRPKVTSRSTYSAPLDTSEESESVEQTACQLEQAVGSNPPVTNESDKKVDTLPSLQSFPCSATSVSAVLSPSVGSPQLLVALNLFILLRLIQLLNLK